MRLGITRSGYKGAMTAAQRDFCLLMNESRPSDGRNGFARHHGLWAWLTFASSTVECPPRTSPRRGRRAELYLFGGFIQKSFEISNDGIRRLPPVRHVCAAHTNRRDGPRPRSPTRMGQPKGRSSSAQLPRRTSPSAVPPPCARGRRVVATRRKQLLAWARRSEAVTRGAPILREAPLAPCSSLAFISRTRASNSPSGSVWRGHLERHDEYGLL
jgi:hypothetical protein